MTSLDVLERKISYVFQQPSLALQALTHSSLKRKTEFQRLEFLGDRVLGLVMATVLYDHFPKEPEGALARRFAALVSRQTCEMIAININLENHLQHNADENSRKSIVADALEALMAAVYRDGGFEAAYSCIQHLWLPYIDKLAAPPKDAKSAVQEWAQKKGITIPTYDVLSCAGPVHAPEFKVALLIEGTISATGYGASRRQAEQEAAKAFLQTL